MCGPSSLSRCRCGGWGYLSEVGAVGPPAVPRAVEEPVRAFPERLPVLGAGFTVALSLVSGEVAAFLEDVDEVVPSASGVGDDCSPPSSSKVASLAPPWTVVFGMSCPSSTCSV
jgi:hypothetical protein